MSKLYLALGYNIMIFLRKIVTLKIVTLSILCFLSANVWANASMIGFSGSEHVAIGDQVILQPFVASSNQERTLLTLPNGLRLSYGSILALGDFYGTVNLPISLGKSQKAREGRFLRAFNALATQAFAQSEVPAILQVMSDEKMVIEEGIRHNESEQFIFEKIGFQFERRYSCITGGSCSDKTWLLYPGRYIKLAGDNFDHFGEQAITAYKTGHQLAINLAIQAFQTQDLQQLEIAYAMNAFASHFLSDRFSSGHIRTPRMKLSQKVPSSVVSGLLAGLMHNEDNYYGLHVGNLRGEEWVAYGDKSYFFNKSSVGNQKQFEALQSSVDDIYFAYQYGYASPDVVIDALIPYQNASLGYLDTSPLFYWDGRSNILMRRQYLNEPYNTRSTSIWLSWPTLVALSKGKNMKLPDHSV